MGLVTTEIVSKNKVETDRSVLASEKEASAINNKASFLCLVWVAANEGQNLRLRCRTCARTMRRMRDHAIHDYTWGPMSQNF